MRLKALILLACIPLLSLAGCAVFLAVPLQVTPTAQTVAIDEGAGVATAAWTLRGKGIITVDFGDGLRETIELQAEIDRTIAHTYALIGTYPVRFTQGRTVQHAEATVTCTLPIVDPPFYLDTLVGDGERIDMLFTRRAVGCESTTGAPAYYSGIAPGSGMTEFRVIAWHGSKRIALFDETGRNIRDEWIELAMDVRSTQIITCWAGNYSDGPVTPMECDPDDPWVAPIIPPDARFIQFAVTVRNQYMRTADWISRAWIIWVAAGTCSAL